MKYMLLDVTTSAKLVLVAPMREVQLHARLHKAENPDVRLIAPPVEGRSFAKLEANQLLHLLYSLGETPAEDYESMVQQALRAVDARPVDETSAESLQKEVDRRALPEPDLNHEPKPKGEAKPKAEPKPKKERSTEFSNPERPKAGTTTGLVWEFADALLAKLGRMPTSKEVAAECEKEGIKAGTASVQFGKWKAYQKVHQTS